MLRQAGHSTRSAEMAETLVTNWIVNVFENDEEAERFCRKLQPEIENVLFWLIHNVDPTIQIDASELRAASLNMIEISQRSGQTIANQLAMLESLAGAIKIQEAHIGRLCQGIDRLAARETELLNQMARDEEDQRVLLGRFRYVIQRQKDELRVLNRPRFHFIRLKLLKLSRKAKKLLSG